MYAVEVIICSALFYLLYRLLLEGRVAYGVARAYLVLSVLLSAVIPMLELPILPAEPMVQFMASTIEIDNLATELGVEVDVERTLDWYFVLQMVYVAVVLFSIVRFILSVVKIYKLRKTSSLSRYRSAFLAQSHSITEPFSFLRTIFVPQGESREQVLLHEYSHILHIHTFERLFFEFARAVFWFNPFVHMISSCASQVHEWQADNDVICAGFDIHEYRQIIFHQLFGYSPDITCGLNKSLTKKRFIMMTKFNRERYPLLRICAVIPIVVAMIFAFGATNALAEPVAKSPEPKSVIEIRKGGEQILLNSKPVTINELAELIKQTDDRVVTIDAEADVPMGKVTDVKESLRGIERLKINYAKPEVKRLEIEPCNEQSSQSEPKEKAIKARNLLSVKVSADGTILLRGDECSKSELKREVKRFVQNYHIYAMNTRRLHVGNLKNSEYSDFSTTALTMPNGDRVCCPVSNGIVSVTSDSNATFDAVQSVLTTINEAYYDLRQNLSRRVYNTPYDKLGVEYRQMVNNAIPSRVYMAEC